MSKIEWTGETWNPIVGCSIVSPGCTNCYAMQMAARIEAMQDAAVRAGKEAKSLHYSGTTKWVNGTPVWTGKVALAPEHILLKPLSWKKPHTIFVNSVGDLFHEGVPDEWIDRVFAVMALCPQHTFQVLTKRSARMRAYMTDPERKRTIYLAVLDVADAMARAAGTYEARPKLDDVMAIFRGSGPFKNIWLGVSTERQEEADERIPDLLATPAAVRFVSAEPLLGPIDFTICDRGGGAVSAFHERNHHPNAPRVHWIIVGGESGHDARPMHPDWARSIRDQCASAGVPFFFKQWGEFTSVSEVEGGGAHFTFVDGATVRKVGHARAGRLLDGRDHNDMPQDAPHD